MVKWFDAKNNFKTSLSVNGFNGYNFKDNYCMKFEVDMEHFL